MVTTDSEANGIMPTHGKKNLSTNNKLQTESEIYHSLVKKRLPI